MPLRLSHSFLPVLKGGREVKPGLLTGSIIGIAYGSLGERITLILYIYVYYRIMPTYA